VSHVDHEACLPGVLARVTAPHFVAGLVLRAATVHEAAPILRYMLGWSAQRVARYCAHKGWGIARVPADADGVRGSVEPPAY
jgi:hypothetical protein